MEGGGFATNMMAGQGPPITPTLLPRDVLPTITPVVVPTTIVPEVLTQGNYDYWSTCVTWYLVGQDLWEVCTMKFEDIPDAAEDPVAYSVWKKKNAMALHAIQISCSREMFSQIRDKTLASEAWDFLKRISNQTPPSMEQSPAASGEQPPAASASTGNADFSQYEDLLKALDRGDWNAIELFLESNPDAGRAKISPTGETALHIAVRDGYVKAVKGLVQKLSPDDLNQLDNSGQTPLGWAAAYGFKEIAECMIRRNPKLTSILDRDGWLPVVFACNQGKKEMTRFLYSHTPLEELAPGKGHNGATLLSYCIGAKFLDIALDIIDKFPRSAVTLNWDGGIPLNMLGIMPSLFKSGSQLWFWQRWIYSCITVKVDQPLDQVQLNVIDDATSSRDARSNIEKVLGQLPGLVSYPLKLLGIKNIHDQKLRHAQAIKLVESICTELQNMTDDVQSQVHEVVIRALKQGNVDFVTMMIKSIPKLVWNDDENGRNIFFIAILNRQEKIFSLLHGLSDVNKTKVISYSDSFGNKILHLVAMLAPSDQVIGISGAALLIQRELQWYEEVESIVPTIFKEVVNLDQKKPSEVFSQQHAHLVKEGEKWMKEIATSSSFVAALIVTIMFAAAFTIPGGNNDKGAPILGG